MCHSLTHSNTTDDLQWHIEAVMYTKTQVDICTCTLKVTSTSVSCRSNLQSDTWRWANNYKAIKQANPGGVETMIKKATRWNWWQILHCILEDMQNIKFSDLPECEPIQQGSTLKLFFFFFTSAIKFTETKKHAVIFVSTFKHHNT